MSFLFSWVVHVEFRCRLQNRIISFFHHLFHASCLPLVLVFVLSPQGLSQLVRQEPGGLVYNTYANEGQTNAVHTVPDFSRAGYMGGGGPIPFVPTRITITNGPGDDTTLIQNAIDTVSALPLVDGFRGAVLLKAGEYTVSSTLSINSSGVVLRGEGQQDGGGTRITYTATTQSDLFDVQGSGGPSGIGDTFLVADALVPVGAKSLTVSDAFGFSPGDMIRVKYMMNQQWIDDIGMTVPPLAGGEDDPAWTPAGFQLEAYRYVEAVDGNELILDAPIVQVIDSQYGGAEVQKHTYDNAIEHVGLEALRLESSYAGSQDENHGWHAIFMARVRNGWVRQITSRYFGKSLVLIDNSSQFITVQDAACLDPVSLVDGGRRYSFYVDDSSYLFFQRCLTRYGRHDFVSGSRTPGPNVFVDSLATHASNDSGPHFRYATGELYDNIKSSNDINVQNRMNSGTSHGWAGAQIMFWNVNANNIRCDAPVGAMNWSIGAVGDKAEGQYGPQSLAEPFGIWESEDVPVTPRSLYFAQLEDRLGPNAVNAVLLPQQKKGTIWDALQRWDGDGLFLNDVVCWVDETASVAVNSPVNVYARIRNLQMKENLTGVTWSKLSGPGEVLFGDAARVETTASFSAAGGYEIQLVANDGVRQVIGSVSVFVQDPSDVTAPSAPDHVTASPSFNMVSLDWDDNTEPDFISYTVYRRETTGSFSVPLMTTITSSEYMDFTAENDTTYDYVITAFDVNGNESTNSRVVTATPTDNDPAPLVFFLYPQDGESFLAGTDLEVAVDATDLDGNVAWVQLYLDGALVRQENAAPWTWNVGGQNDLLLNNLSAGRYDLEVVAADNDGQITRLTNAVHVVTDLVAPASPSGLTATSGDGFVDLDWSDNTENDVASYSVYRSQTSGTFAEALETGFLSSDYTDETAFNGITYYYVVTAVDSSGNESAESSVVSVTPIERIDFGTNTGKVFVSEAGFSTIVPGTGTGTHVADAYRMAAGADAGHENYAFLQSFDGMGGTNRNDFVMTLEASLFSKGSALKNNYRYGLVLFNDSTNLEGAGVDALLLYDDANLEMILRTGLNDTILVSEVFKTASGTGRPYDYPEGETYTFQVTGVYEGDNLTLTYNLTDGIITRSISTTVDAATLPGNQFGGAARIRNGFTVDFDHFSMFTEGVDYPPSAPAGVVASPGNGFVTLDWSDNPEDDLTGYTVYRSTVSGSNGVELVTGLSASAHTDANVENGTTYYYKVVSVDVAGQESESSAEVSATPDAVLNVSVGAVDSATARSNNEVQDNREVLEVKRSDFSGPNSRVAFIRFPLDGMSRLGGIPAAEIENVTLDVYVTQNENSDTLTVYGLNDEARFSGETLSETTWTGGTDGTSEGGNNLKGDTRPDGAHSLPNSLTTDSLGTLTFAPVADAGFKQIEITNLTAFRNLVTQDTNGEITLLIRGNLDGVQAQIVSVFTSGAHPVPTLSASGEAPTLPAPAAPEDLSASAASASSILLNWSDSSSFEDGFLIQRATQSGGPWTNVTTTASNMTAYTDTGLGADVFFYQVLATSSAHGNSAPGNEAAASTLDSDSDGMIDEFEALAGSDPNDSSSQFKLFTAAPVSGNVIFEVATAEGSHYRVFYKDSLFDETWQHLYDFTGDGNVRRIEDSPPGSRFYKLQVRATAW